MFSPFKPEPAPPDFGQGKVIPEEHASILSRLFCSWISPLLSVGFTRPLEQADLWDLPEHKHSSGIADLLEKNFYSRCPPEKRPRFIRDASAQARTTRDEKCGVDSPEASLPDLEKASRAEQYDASLTKTLFVSFRGQILRAGALKLFAETLKTTSPLVSKVLLSWLTACYAFHHLSDAQRSDEIAQGLVPPQGIGYGIGIAFALFAMQEIASLSTNHFMLASMNTGVYIRTGLIGNIFRKSLRLSGRARLDHSVGHITNLISSDTARLDRFSNLIHDLWVAPLQIILGIGLLVGTLGYSALVGLGVLLLGLPVQLFAIKIMVKQRKKGVKITDERMRLITEVLQGIRLIKAFAWEDVYSYRIWNLRTREIKTIKIAAIARGLLFALIMFLPVLASTLSFVTYALSGHDLNVAVIFASLQLFNVIRGPLTWLPISLGILAESLIALRRISTFLQAEELEEPYLIDTSSANAIDIDGDFSWEMVQKADSSWPKENHVLSTSKKGGEKDEDSISEDEEPFSIDGLKMRIKKGSFVAIVGKVGSGKSSLMQAMIGEMRRTRGRVTFGGSVAYVPQSAWIKNLSLRENVTFGLPDDEKRFKSVVKACCLERDIDMLPHNENTEIGEKGINLSGGQKARVSLARAAYSHSDIILMDDSLSAVDAHVGRAILEDCILSGPLADRTRVLVTHALHVLDKADYVYVIDDGRIVEEGTFKDLTGRKSMLAALIDEYGSMEEESQVQPERTGAGATQMQKFETPTANAALMQLEERVTGAVTWTTYTQYFRHAGSIAWAPAILFILVLLQGSAVGTNIILGFWTGSASGYGISGFSQSDYTAVYASFGLAQGILSFIMTCTYLFMCLQASLSLFKSGWSGILHSPMVFFDTTPIGRILSRFSKDQDVLDKELAMISIQFIYTFSALWGTVFLVFYTFPLLGIIFAPMVLMYYVIFLYYRRSSVETKRLDSLLRSKLYSSFSETLTGLATIRAYGIQRTSISAAEHGLDWGNKAYYITVAIQRWLSLRLDLFTNVLILGICLFAAGFRTSINPSKIGVVLTYTLSVTQMFSDMVAQFTQTEQNMNAVERLLEYAALPIEGERSTVSDPPKSEWPATGTIDFKQVVLSYRKDLPPVLRGVSFSIRAGEKVGIVGRTGAGKSSLLQALFRMVEVQSGTILLDGVDTRHIGLDTLRNALSLVPQDSVLFYGTLRDNIDPTKLRTDAELMDILRRVWLLPPVGTIDTTAEAKFSLSAMVGDEGSNYSAGEKQLLAVARALAKNSRIIVLDEATSSVDVETDSKLQRTIQTEFSSCTLLCIAHRLNTIAYYDRVMVMDNGEVAEFDTVLNLFDREDSIFRSLCDEASLSRVDILKIQESSRAV